MHYFSQYEIKNLTIVFQFLDNVIGLEALVDLVECMVDQCCLDSPLQEASEVCFLNLIFFQRDLTRIYNFPLKVI